MDRSGSDSRSAADLRPWVGRAVLHVDMDAFFASVEQLDHPEWRGHPVVVGGSPDKRGVIAAASYEARRYGVRSAMPAARAAQLLPPDAIWTRGDFERYGEVSQQLFEILAGISPEVQVASIDEAYLDATPGSRGVHPVEAARSIMEAVDGLGVTCSVGVATSKTVAKIASDRDKPHGLTVVWPGNEERFLSPLAIELMPGIGPATATRLRTLGIRLLGDLAALDDETARQVLGSHGPATVLRARGIDARPVRDRETVKSVSNERTFSKDIREDAEVRDALAGLAEKVASRLRRKGLRGRTVHIKIRFGDFTTRTVQETLGTPTSATDEIAEVAGRLLASQWNKAVGLRLLGVGMSGFDDQPLQLELPVSPEAPSDERRRAIERTVDELRERFGEGAVRFGTRRPASRYPRDRYGPEG
jgi:DNA polymerase IV